MYKSEVEKFTRTNDAMNKTIEYLRSRLQLVTEQYERKLQENELLRQEVEILKAQLEKMAEKK